jgi:phage terminase large subunit-like protein
MNVATRWHPKDPSGVLIAEGWESVNLTAIAEENDVLGRAIGEALAPAIRPIDFLLQQKRDLTDGPFAAMYQGRPRPRGGTVFHEPNFYTELPREGYAVGFGIDLAYTAKSSADWSICLELWRVGVFDDPQAKFYVVGVDRAQVEAPSFALTLKGRSVRRPGAKFLWRASGTEKGSATFLRAQGIPIIWTPPPGDKFVSATAVGAAWNDGRVLVPDPEEFPEAKRWLPAFLQSIDDFTGVGDEQDDDVDALGNAHRLLTSKKGTEEQSTGSGGHAGRPERTV